MNSVTDVYRTPASYTKLTHCPAALSSIPEDLAGMVAFVKKLLIHPIEARSLGLHFDYRATLRRQLEYRSVDDILSDAKVASLLKTVTAQTVTQASKRGIFSCDHHVVLFVSVCRLKGIEARARCGYATYLVAGKLVPHWICEVYTAKHGWSQVDPEQSRLSLATDDFRLSGRIWLECRHGNMDWNQALPDYRHGADGVKYRLLNDLNGVMKNELLNYHWIVRTSGTAAPDIFRKRVSQLTEEQMDLLDSIAMLSLDVDKNLVQLTAQYRSYVHPENLHFHDVRMK